MSLEHKLLNREGYSIHYFVSGNADSVVDADTETIVFLHPAFGDHNCFSDQVDFFLPKYRLIMVDMLGHGLSKVGRSKDRIDKTPEHILEIMRLEGVERAHVVGVSMGSLIAQYFALQNPEMVLSLTALGGYTINRVNREIAKSQRKEIFKWLFKMIFSMDSFRRYVAGVTLVDKGAQARFYESAKGFSRKSFTIMTGVDKLIANRDTPQRNYPLMIAVGEKDSALARGISLKWHEEEPRSRFYLIEGAGHCANMDRAEQFNELLFEFIRDY